MDTHLYTKWYNLAFLVSQCSFIMKILVEKFIVLQIQTAPSRLQPASARCFLAVMILPSAPSGIRAHAQHATLHFKTSESRQVCRAKYEIVTRRPIYSCAK